ncbi:PKD domain containing protein [Paenibacillus mucilaginosus KNP414]|uniref:PKD domain containing protein n=2 Tax=Paenibacillus mucilaginosus TaxID=61624 RepID=F8F9N9_PAEMK|nr:PKD domain containing protein [Paenibacillus mucilaginosus KNP414]
MIKIRKLLNGKLFGNFVDFETVQGSAPYGEDRNYYMKVDTLWKAKTYIYEGYIDITYGVPTTPDLSTVSLQTDTTCIAVNDTVTFKYAYRNDGDSTTTPFKVQLRANGTTVLKTETVSGGARNGVLLTGTFTYKFTHTAPVDFTLVVDSDQAVTDDKNRSNNALTERFTAVASCGGGPAPGGPEVVTADFKILITPTLPYGEDNTFQPDISITGGEGCSLAAVTWTYVQGSLTHTFTTTQGNAQGFNGPPYPKGMGAGRVDVTMKVKSTCGTEVTSGPKSFEVVLPADGNEGPVYEPGFFDGGNTYEYPPVQRVVLGDRVDLGIIHDPTTVPKTPYDPEDDGIIYYFDFKGSSSEWLRSVAEDKGWWEYDPHFGPVTADVLGTHEIQVTATDTRGARGQGSPKTARLEVVAPNPVPIITLPPKVVEGRTFTPDISCAKSYSPKKNGKISECLWTGKMSLYPTAGPVPITLEVKDHDGMMSLQPARDTLVVQPDLPPVVQLDNPGYGVRGSTMYFKDTSYSPDQDPIETHQVKLACDSNNNGSYADESWTGITPDASGSFTYNPARVGKCSIEIYMKEALGYKKDARGSFTFEIVNEAPEVDFYVQGSDFQPPEMTSKSFDAAALLGAAWKTSSVSRAEKGKEYLYHAQEGALETAAVNSQGISVLNRSITQRVLQWSCPQSWDYCRGAGNMVKPDVFVGSSGNTWVNTNSTSTAYMPQYGVMTDGSGYWNNNYKATVNYELGRVKFVASDRHTGSSGGYNYYTYVYSLGDIETSSRMDGSTMPAKPKYLYYLKEYVKFSEPSPDRPPTPPPSSIWTEPAPKPLYQVGALPQVTYGGTVNAVTVMDTDLYGGTPRIYGTDFAGNVYSYNCYFSEAKYENVCDLQKKTPGGAVIWSIPSVYSTASYWVPSIYNGVIRYISGDNAKLVVGKGLYDNATGALIRNIADSERMIAGFADDRAVYYSAYVTGENEESRYENSYLHTLDLRSLSEYSTYLGPSLYDKEDSEYVYGSDHYATTLTADHKIMFARNDASNIVLYEYDLNLQPIAKIAGQSKGGTPAAPVLMADGSIMVHVAWDDDSSYSYQAWIVKGEAERENADLASYGQFYNGTETLMNGEVSAAFKLNYDSGTDIASYGVSGRMMDHRNMYRLEVSNKKSKLVKLVDGKRTVLREASYPVKFGTYVNVRLKMNGSRLKGYVNGVPLLEAEDTTFGSAGMYGPYSETRYVAFKNFTSTAYVGDTNPTHNTVVVGTPAEYVKSYGDRENDPGIAELTRWKYTHTSPNKFLDAGDGFSGLSAYHGSTVTSPYASMDKVGVFRVEYSMPDDPAPEPFRYPNAAFASYRKYSDVKSQTVIVHRRPISEFTLGFNTDGTVWWSDASRDPDRWLGGSQYSTEPTGIDYAATRGVVERKRNYTTPGGELKNGQLTRPTESGVYTVRQAVKDEYGAWSEWYEVTIEVTMPVTNAPPAVSLTYPNGTQASPTFVGARPTITWNQSDPDPNTLFSVYDIAIKDESGTCVRCLTNRPMDTYETGWSWTMDTDLAMGKKYQVQVRVSDGTDWSPWSNVGWMQTNRPPAAYMTYPYGTQDAPTVMNTARPLLRWSQTDPDPAPVFTFYQLQITNEANDVLILDSGRRRQNTTDTSASWSVPQDLPAGQKLRVRVKVWDVRLVLP